MRIFKAIRMWWQASVSGNIRLSDYQEEIDAEKVRINAAILEWKANYKGEHYGAGYVESMTKMLRDLRDGRVER